MWSLAGSILMPTTEISLTIHEKDVEMKLSSCLDRWMGKQLLMCNIMYCKWYLSGPTSVGFTVNEVT